MGIFSGIVSVIICVFLMWMLVRYYKTNPEAFSSANLNKSALTMGVLALGLILLVGVVVLLLRA